MKLNTPTSIIRSTIRLLSIFMAGLMSFFSPLTLTHGDQGCCAECALKREEEIEVRDEEETKTDGE